MRKLRMVFIISLVVICIGLIPASGVLADSKSPIVKLQGIIDAQTTDGSVGFWVIGDYTVQVDTGTVIVEAQGDAVEGAEVAVIARRGWDDTLTAMVIRVLRGDKSERRVTIRGTVTEVEPDYIVTNGVQIRLNERTRIEGSLAEGELVTIRAQTRGAEITALEVQVRNRLKSHLVEFTGEIEAIDETTGTWTIAGKTVMVNERTDVQDEPEVGDTVVVHAEVQEDDSLLGVRIVSADSVVSDPEEVTFTGVIQRAAPNNNGRWVISGQHVIVGPRTVIIGVPEIGAEAEVRGIRSGVSTLVALEIIINEGPEELTFTGTVNKMPPGRPVGLWVIDTWRVVVVPDTEVIGTPTEGATVQFTIRQNGRNGSLVATRIEVLDAPEPTTEPTEEPTIPATVPATVPADKDKPALSPSAAKTPKPDKTFKLPKPDKLPKAPKGNGRKGG